MMEKNAKIYVAGHKGMVGSAIVRELKKQGYENLVFRTHKELDLTRQADVEAFLPRKSRTMCSIPLEKWAALWPTRTRLQIFCMKT